MTAPEIAAVRFARESVKASKAGDRGTAQRNAWWALNAAKEAERERGREPFMLKPQAD